MISLIKYPKRTRALLWAFVFSVALHLFGIAVMRYGPVLRMAMGLGELEYVDEAYNRAILIDFSKKKLKYPSGYAGFRSPQKVKSLDEMKKEEARRRRLEEARRRREEEERRRREEEIARREAEEKARAEQEARAQADLAKANAQPTPAPTPPADGYGRFGKINTAPIKDQIQRLYDAKKAGTLVLPEGKLRVYRSKVGGNEWEALTKGLPQQDCYVNILRDAMAVDQLDPCGIYFGTTGGQVYGSADGGDSWAPIVRDLPTVLSVEVQTL